MKKSKGKEDRRAKVSGRKKNNNPQSKVKYISVRSEATTRVGSEVSNQCKEVARRT